MTEQQLDPKMTPENWRKPGDHLSQREAPQIVELLLEGDIALQNLWVHDYPAEQRLYALAQQQAAQQLHDTLAQNAASVAVADQIHETAAQWAKPSPKINPIAQSNNGVVDMGNGMMADANRVADAQQAVDAAFEETVAPQVAARHQAGTIDLHDTTENHPAAYLDTMNNFERQFADTDAPYLAGSMRGDPRGQAPAVEMDQPEEADFFRNLEQQFAGTPAPALANTMDGAITDQAPAIEMIDSPEVIAAREMVERAHQNV